MKQDAADQQAEDAERAAARQKREEEAQLRADGELSGAESVMHYQRYPLPITFTMLVCTAALYVCHDRQKSHLLVSVLIPQDY